MRDRLAYSGSVRGRRTAALLTAGMVLTACTSVSKSEEWSGPPVHTAAPGMCHGGEPPAAWEHVVWVWFENKDPSAVIGSVEAPYLTSLAQSCGMATNYAALMHPSLPNYIGATSGDTHGVDSNESPAAFDLEVPSIFSQLGPAGWRSYQESMTHNCDVTSTGPLYAVKHNPAAYYTNIRDACATQNVPLEYPLDLSAAFTFVTPDLCHDMHDCSVLTGDQWLADFMAEVAATQEFQDGSTAVFITFDEDEGPKTLPENLVPMVVVAPNVEPGTRVRTSYTHYSLLRTTQEMLGLPLLGEARVATSMRGQFNL